jgi:hypothetical protein
MNAAKEFLGHVADFCVGMAKAHQAAMDGCEEGDTSHTFHKAAMNECLNMADKCVASAKNFKAMGGNDPDARVPMLISAIATENPNVRPVFRAGMREFGKAEVPAQFAKIVAVDEETE